MSASTPAARDRRPGRPRSLLLTRRSSNMRRVFAWLGHGVLLLLTSSSALAVLFIFYFIAKDAIPFFELRGIREFFTSTAWYPAAEQPSFGALAIFFGSGMVTLGAVVVAVPLGITAAVCLSDILPFNARQIVKPVVEVLAAIPSVAYGFFALVVFARLLQDHGGTVLCVLWWCVALPVAALLAFVTGGTLACRVRDDKRRKLTHAITSALLLLAAGVGVYLAGTQIDAVKIASGANALNVSVILGIMALPTVISVSEDALQAVGRDLREGAYALGSTRAEVLVRVVLPAAAGGIGAAVILGVMRAIGETMVVWMASGNAAQIPHPWYNFLAPVRTLTATIAGDMGEADHITGSARYHVLFAMALALLTISFLCNVVSEQVIRRNARKHA